MLSPLPGAVGISGLRVYDWPTADGLCGGSPHVHLTCAEAYVVVAGQGSVQTLTCDGFAETPLAPGTVAWFTPGTVHRLVNGDGGLHIVVVMQNSGLPEAGDAVFTFPPETLNDPEAYGRAAALDPGAREHTARSRRDLALAGFTALRARLDAGEPTALHDFYRSAVRLKAHLFPEWEKRWQAGAFAEALRTGAQLSRLGAGDIGPLTEAAVHRLDPPPERAFGMCGRLDTYVP
ncbi:cupin domain-containing protein [Actinoallomurus liliacearum]|uniref:Cupin domain-containing protein n=1 Tax=Actinoallomurus liliacearum TaxID=1080073 RepID=A0ABP8U2D6_9ACTN